MTEEIIKDFGGRIIGYVEVASNGDKTGKDFYRCIVGYYDHETDTTKDFQRRVVSQGDTLSSLIWQSKR
jgi:hypothetical protein